MEREGIHHQLRYRAIFSDEIKRALRKWRRKDRMMYEWIEQQIDKILDNPGFGKPLRYSLKFHRRLHVGSFVLTYKIDGAAIYFVDFDHHDTIYNKEQ